MARSAPRASGWSRSGLLATVGALAVAMLGLAAGAAGAEMAITGVDIDGSAVACSRGSPLAVSSAARSIRIHCGEIAPEGKLSARLRYRLDGHDGTWHDMAIGARASILFLDGGGQVVGSSDIPMTGETPGWTGEVESSEFVLHRGQATAPDRAVTVRINFLSHGGDNAMCVVGIDAARLRIEHAGAEASEVGLGIASGRDIDRPLGSPDNWFRCGTRAEIAVLRIRPLPSPHPILVLDDGDPYAFGNWSTRNQGDARIEPGDVVTLEWQAAYSIGGSGAWVAEYPQLAPGAYVFRVAATRPNGEPTGREAALAFQVRAPLHQRWEFWLTVLALLVAGGTWISRVATQRNLQRRLAEHERREAAVRERERIARDLHDNIGAGLTEIAMQSDWVHSDLEQGATAATRARVVRIRQSAIELARSVDEIVWAVNPANDTLKRFCNYATQCAAQFLEAAGVRVRFDIPQDLPDRTVIGKVRHNLFLVLREALHNAAKHARAGLVQIELRLVEDRLRVVIHDDGCGFDPAQAGAAGTHEGLDSMRKRMADIGGSFQLSSGPGNGTRIELLVDIASSGYGPAGAPA